MSPGVWAAYDHRSHPMFRQVSVLDNAREVEGKALRRSERENEMCQWGEFKALR